MKNPPKTSAFPTKDEMIAYFAHLVSDVAQKAVLDRGFAAIALSGGTTPEAFYTALAQQQDFPWKAADFFMVDERFVPPGHADNNFVMVQRAFSKAPIEATRLHPVHTELPDAAAAAQAYQDEVRAFFARSGANAEKARADRGHESPPRFDLIVLGMGKDGHTASLFPGTGAADVEGPLCLAVTPLTAPHERVSLSLPVLNAARHVLFLMFGADKRDMYTRVRSGADKNFPASLVSPADGQLEFLVSSDVVSE